MHVNAPLTCSSLTRFLGSRIRHYRLGNDSCLGMMYLHRKNTHICSPFWFRRSPLSYLSLSLTSFPWTPLQQMYLGENTEVPMNKPEGKLSISSFLLGLKYPSWTLCVTLAICTSLGSPPCPHQTRWVRVTAHDSWFYRRSGSYFTNLTQHNKSSPKHCNNPEASLCSAAHEVQTWKINRFKTENQAIQSDQVTRHRLHLSQLLSSNTILRTEAAGAQLPLLAELQQHVHGFLQTEKKKKERKK